jgi:hypothetical protein
MINSKPVITRRRLLMLVGATAGARFCPDFASESAAIAPQPYFAEVNRALETSANLGAPLRAADAQQLGV